MVNQTFWSLRVELESDTLKNKHLFLYWDYNFSLPSNHPQAGRQHTSVHKRMAGQLAHHWQQDLKLEICWKEDRSNFVPKNKKHKLQGYQ